MAIGTPTSLGTSTSAGGNASNAACTITTTGAIVAGNLVVWIGAFLNVTSSSLSDGTNTYTKAAGASGTVSSWSLEMWYKENAAAVSSGAALQMTFTGSDSGGFGYYIAALQVSGIASASSLDATNNSVIASSFTASPTLASGALAQSSELLIGASTLFGATGLTYTESSGFTNLLNSNAGSLRMNTGIGYDIVSSAGSVTYGPTWSSIGSPNREGIALASFKGASTVVPFFNMPMMGM